MGLGEEGIAVGLVGESAYRAFAAACEGVGVVAFEYDKEAWFRVADVLNSNDGTYTVAELGEHVRTLYFSAAGYPADDFPLGSESEAIAWRAAAVHMFNLIQGGGEGNLRSAEASWASWAREQLSPAQEG